MTKRGAGVGNLPPVDNDDGGDSGDDEQWSFNWIRQRYGAYIAEWAREAPEAKKIKEVIYEMMFQQQPKITMRPPEKKHDDANWSWGGPAPKDLTNYGENEITMFLQWQLDLKPLYGQIKEMIRNSSIWNYLSLDDDALEKGSFFHYVLADLISTQFMQGIDKQSGYQIYQYIADHKQQLDHMIQQEAGRFSRQPVHQIQIGKPRIEMLNPKGYSGGWIDSVGTAAKAVFPYKVS